MKLSKPTRDRLIAAIASVLVVAIAFGVIFAAKSCNRYNVSYYVDSEVVRVDKVGKGDCAENWVPEITDGRRFDCWVTEDGEEYNFFTPVEENLKLYAKWME